MAKKKVKAVKKSEPSQLDSIESELNDLFKGLSLVNNRIDRIVDAIDKSKKVKGL